MFRVYASGTDMHPDQTHLFLTSMLSMRISFPIFRMFFLYTLSMRIRNWCMHWECATGNDAYPEHTCQELMWVLIICVRNWWVYWACAPGTNACEEPSPFKTSWAFAPGTAAHPEHTCICISFLRRMLSLSVKIQNLKRSLQNMLSIRVRNWCVHWASASGTAVHSQHAQQKLNYAKLPQKLK